MALISETTNSDFEAMLIIDRLVKLLKRKWKFTCILFLTIVCGVYLALLFSNNSYDSAAQVLVKLGRENTQVPITVEKGDVYSTGVQKEEIHSYMRLMTSNEIISQTIDELGLARFEFKADQPKTAFQRIKFLLKKITRWAKSGIEEITIQAGLRSRLSHREKVFKLLKRSLNVVREKDSNVISLFIRLPDPILARDVINKVLELYQGYHIDLNKQENMATIFEDLTANDKVELDRMETQIDKVKQEWKLSYPELQIQTLIQNIQSLKLNRDLQIIQREELTKKGEKLRSQIATLPKTQVRAELMEINPSAAYLKEQLVKLQVEEARMVKAYREDSEVVKTITDRVKDIKTLLTQEEETNSMGTTIQPNPLYEELFKEIKNVEVKIGGLDASIPRAQMSIQTIENEIETLTHGQVQLGVLQREFSVIETRYLANAARYERVKTDQTLDENRVANISILSRPLVSAEPAAPKKLTLLILGILMAIFVSTGITLLREWLSQKIYDEKDILEMKDITFLGSYSLPK